MEGRTKTGKTKRTSAAAAGDAKSSSPVVAIRNRRERDRINRFLVQQCVARRFMHQFSAEYDALVAVRTSIEGCFANSPHAVLQELLKHQQADILTAGFWLLETRKGRRAVDSGDVESATEEVIDMHALKGFHNDEQVHRVVRLLIAAVAPFTRLAEELMDRFNYFDYFSLLSMTTVVRGDVLHASYDGVVNSKFKFVTPIPGVESAYQWLHGARAFADLNLTLAISYAAREPRFYGSGIEIFDSEHNAVSIDGRPVDRSLFLRIDLTKVPGAIDAALVYLRAAIMDALGGANAMLDDVEGYESFLATRFAATDHSVNTIVGGNNQLEGALLGLWAWDLTRLEGKTRDEACQHIAREIFGHNDPIMYVAMRRPGLTAQEEEAAVHKKERTTRKHLDTVKGWIEGGRTEIAANLGRDLDQAVTGQAHRALGPRT